MNITIHPNALIFWPLTYFAIFISLNTLAFETLSERDLQKVSAVSGRNIINILGAPSAGIKTDSLKKNDTSSKNISKEQLNSTHKTVDELTSNSMRSFKEGTITTSISSEAETLTQNDIKHAIDVNKQTINTALSKTSNSEIQYKDGNISHEMQVLNNGQVEVTRDLSIDLLKVENLRIDENANSMGNIYLSSWRSQGTTQMITHD